MTGVQTCALPIWEHDPPRPVELSGTSSFGGMRWLLRLGVDVAPVALLRPPDLAIALATLDGEEKRRTLEQRKIRVSEGLGEDEPKCRYLYTAGGLLLPHDRSAFRGLEDQE